MSNTREQVQKLQDYGLAIITSSYPVEFKRKQLQELEKQIEELQYKQEYEEQSLTDY